MCALKWRNITNGKPLQPSSFEQYIKEVFIELRKEGILYNHKRDFNGDTEFHGVCKSVWEANQKVDPAYGTGAGKAEMGKEGDLKS